MSTVTNLEIFAYLGCLALAVEALADMPPLSAVLLRVAPSIIAISGSYLSFTNGSFVGTVLYFLCAIVSVWAVFKPRDYWDSGARFKINLPPMLLFIVVIAFFVAPKMELPTEFPLSILVGYLLLVCGTLILAVVRPRGRLYILALALFALASAMLVAIMHAEATPLVTRLLSASTGVMILLIGYIPRGMAVSVTRPSGNTFSREVDEEPEVECYDDYDYVISLERQRRACGYKAGWLYFRCKEAGLLDIYEELINSGEIERGGKDHKGSEESNEKANDETQPDPFQILGVSRNATVAEIKAAFREQMKLYHPDKVASLGPELKAVAEKMSKAITAAYEELLKKGK